MFNINRIDPYCMYTAWDLYNLYRVSKDGRLLPRHESYLAHLSINSHDFLGMHLHEMSRNQLKLLVLLVIDRVRPKRQICPKNTLDENYRVCWEAIAIYKCFENELPRNQYYENTPLDLTKIEEEMKFFIWNTDKIINVKFPDVPDGYRFTFYSFKTINEKREYHNYKGELVKSRYSYVETKREFDYIETTSPLVYMPSRRSSYVFRKPYRLNSVYPIIKSNGNNKVTVKQLIVKDESNTVNGWIRGVKALSKRIDETSLLPILLKNVDDLTESDKLTLSFSFTSLNYKKLINAINKYKKTKDSNLI